MKKNKGFSLIELMIVVGIIGILVATALPMYRNYILRVRILETVNAATILLRDAAIGLGSGDLMAGLDVEEIGNKVRYVPWMGSETWHMGCQNGVRMGEVLISKANLSHVGISLPYIWQLLIYGPTRTPCDRDNSDVQEGFEITITLDVDALGVPSKSGRANYNMLQLAVSDEVVYMDVEGNVTRKEVGAVISCGIRPSFSEDIDFVEAMSNYDFPLASIPPMCRYYRMAGSIPRTLIELSGY